MRKIVDSNFMRATSLRSYLTASRHNYAVITDYASMEAYKGETLISIFHSMEILSEFPRQVIILKGTQAICGLSGRGSGLQRRMIDEHQTRGFLSYCKALSRAKAGNQELQRQILALGAEATTHMDRLLVDATFMPSIVAEVSQTYSANELKILRTRTPYSVELISKIVNSILMLAKSMFGSHPRAKRLPGESEYANTYIFRFALCAYLLILRWIKTGGPTTMKPERIRNDMVDLSFAAYATFFDGILTADQNVVATYDEAIFLLRVLFQKRTQMGFGE